MTITHRLRASLASTCRLSVKPLTASLLAVSWSMLSATTAAEPILKNKPRPTMLDKLKPCVSLSGVVEKGETCLHSVFVYESTRKEKLFGHTPDGGAAHISTYARTGRLDADYQSLGADHRMSVTFECLADDGKACSHPLGGRAVESLEHEAMFGFMPFHFGVACRGYRLRQDGKMITSVAGGESLTFSHDDILTAIGGGKADRKTPTIAFRCYGVSSEPFRLTLRTTRIKE